MIMDPNFIVKVLLSLIVAAALAFAVTPLVKRLAQRVGAMDVPKDERRMHKIPIPRMGGLAIFFAFLIAVLCFAGFILVSLVGQQLQIGEKREELASLQEQLSTQTARNEEIQNSLENNSGVAEYAERKARSELDYAKPGERVFVDVGGGS